MPYVVENTNPASVGPYATNRFITSKHCLNTTDDINNAYVFSSEKTAENTIKRLKKEFGGDEYTVAVCEGGVWLNKTFAITDQNRPVLVVRPVSIVVDRC